MPKRGITVIDMRGMIGDSVLCDLCGKDWTASPVSGGFVFESKGVCPDCAPNFMKDIEKYGEQDYIRATCPEGKSHADFIRDYRKGVPQ